MLLSKRKWWQMFLDDVQTFNHQGELRPTAMDFFIFFFNDPSEINVSL